MVMRKKPKRAAPTSDDVVIKVRGLVNAMGENVIHDHLDLDVKRGEVLGVVGGSGTGTSTHSVSYVALRSHHGCVFAWNMPLIFIIWSSPVWLPP